jgi:hypothetical protein
MMGNPMSLLRRLAVAVLALAGSLVWGPPTVLAVCLGRGDCTMTSPGTPATTSTCCVERASAPAGLEAAPEAPARACCGCCVTLRVGTGVDGTPAREKVEAPVLPHLDAPSTVLAAPDLDDAAPVAFVAPPRSSPDRRLPLRI